MPINFVLYVWNKTEYCTTSMSNIQRIRSINHYNTVPAMMSFNVCFTGVNKDITLH